MFFSNGSRTVPTGKHPRRLDRSISQPFNASRATNLRSAFRQGCRNAFRHATGPVVGIGDRASKAILHFEVFMRVVESRHHRDTI